MKFLHSSEGRGAFYIFVGSLALSQWSIQQLLCIISGAYMIGMGVVCIVMGIHFHHKLDDLTKLKPKDLRKMFVAHAKGKEVMSIDDFAVFVKDTTGNELSAMEKEQLAEEVGK